MRNSDLFNLKDDYAKGRCCMLLSAPVTKIIGNLSLAALYSSFLAANDFSIIEVGRLSYIAFFASCLGVFAPGLLEKVEKRRWLLAVLLFSYYLIFLIGLSAAAIFVKDHTIRFFVFAVLIFLGNLLDKINTSGYTAWHLHFIPDSVRARYFLFQQRIQIPISALSLVFLSFIVDYVHRLPNELQVLCMIRVAGFFLGLLNIIILLIPKEFPYLKTAEFSVKNIMMLPLGNRKFSKTILAVGLWSVGSSLTDSAWMYYMLNSIGTGTQFQNIYTVVYGISLIVLGGFFTTVYKRLKWIRTFCIHALIHIPTFFLCAFVTKENYTWLYSLIMIIRGIEGVGLNITYDNLQYINMPETDQTYYLSFSAFITNISSFLGQLLGTFLLGLLGNTVLYVLGRDFDSVQILMVIQTLVTLICPLYLLKNRNELEPLNRI